MPRLVRFAISAGVAIMLTGFVASTPTLAAVIDPNFTVCTATASGACGNEPNTISTSGSFNAFTFGSSGNGPLNPFLLLFAVPNLSPNSGPAGFSPGFTGSNPTVTAASSQQYEQTTTVQAGGYLGELTASSTLSSCKDLYCFAGLNNGNSSENFDNFTKYFQFLTTSGLNQLSNSAIPTSYSVYEYTAQVSGTPTGQNLGNGEIYTIPYTNLPWGTFAAAYGIDKCGPDTAGTGPCPDAQFVYDSAFTVSGFTDGPTQLPPVTLPEPGTLALLGISLTALAFSRRRRIAK